MNEDLDAWLNADVAADVAKSTGTPDLATPMPPGQEPVADPNAKGLQKWGIGRGGVIRNPGTKKVTLTNSNPITNPKSPKLTAKTVPAPTPEEELKALNPGLAIPSVMTGMDMDNQKRNGTGNTSEPPVPVATQAQQPVPVTYESTLKDLLNLAVATGGMLHFGTGEFVLSIQILKAPG